ncbi:phage antirepressor KilAC domain-containing protein [Peptoniphilus sp. MSJ-1]|uniref:Phage antirepressor KilAC domain-containing protein n=1 Tax=Peptoniphilus ovalis TaxID=2841503 RepID=A0ABS6FHU8_9FIRM|nr:phage antirepressor KilAC domain-containing protein [Peptoniphilus ovalis]MBU5669618.1 phage antirepressor KilAC domain-containing protein [Peptoniphilus ovalis]
MKAYTYKELAEMFNTTPQKILKKTKKKNFPKKTMTTAKNHQGRVVKAITEEGIEYFKNEFRVVDEKVNDEDKALLGELKLVKQGEFLGTKCDFYQDMNDNVYMTRKQISDALDYEAESAIVRLHERNKQLDEMSVEISRFNYHTTNCGRGQTAKNSELNKVNLNTLLYNEDGIYEITFLSRQPKADKFRQWVRNVLQTIRKTGGYIDEKDKFVRNYFSTKDEMDIALIKNMMKKTDQLNEELNKQKDIITTQKELLENQKDDVKFAKQVKSSDDSITVNAMAKILHLNGINIGRNRLFKWLRDRKFVTREYQNNQLTNIPTQKAVQMGLLTIEETSFIDKYGNNRIGMVSKVTPKGQQYLLNKFLNGVLS